MERARREARGFVEFKHQELFDKLADRIEALEGEQLTLPEEVQIGPVRFGKGVKLINFINAARRWYEKASASEALVASLRNQLEGAKEALRETLPFAKAWVGQMPGATQEGDNAALTIRLAASTLDRLEGNQEVGSENASLRTTLHGADTEAEPSAEWRDIESGVTVDFTARHLDATMDLGWHEHTFAVTIWRNGEPFTDGRTALEAMGAVIDHIAPVAGDGVRELKPAMWSNEAIGKAIGTLANVIEVHVNRRDDSGFSVRMRR